MSDVDKSSRFMRLKDESGQILPWMALLTVVFLGMAGLTIDLGRAYVSYRLLQSSTDAAALAGAYALAQTGATQTTVTNQIKAYSSMTGKANADLNLPNAVVTPTFKCISVGAIVQAACNSNGLGFNVVQVEQDVSVPTIFIRTLSMFGINSASAINLRSYATATPRSGVDQQVNVAVVIDTTASMGGNDPACSTTRIKCALNGVQSLLGQLTPCTAGSTSGNCLGAYDPVSLFTFPPVQAQTASNDTKCPSSNPSIVPYTSPTPGATWSAPTGANGTYQITSYLDNYSSTNASGGSISGSSALGIATGAGTCQGVQTPGGDGTYLAGSIFAAQSSLMAQSQANGGQNIMIVLTDGDANAQSSRTNFTGSTSLNETSSGLSVSYPSVNNQCSQSIGAANYATGQGTTVYTVGYGAGNSGCATDTGTHAITACQELLQMASSPGDFYTDTTSACGGASVGSLNTVFSAIGASLTKARLVPNGIS